MIKNGNLLERRLICPATKREVTSDSSLEGKWFQRKNYPDGTFPVSKSVCPKVKTMWNCDQIQSSPHLPRMNLTWIHICKKNIIPNKHEKAWWTLNSEPRLKILEDLEQLTHELPWTVLSFKLGNRAPYQQIHFAQLAIQESKTSRKVRL